MPREGQGRGLRTLTIRHVLCIAALVALAAAMASVIGCGHMPVPVDTDIYFVGINANQEELTIPPGTRVELGVYRQMSNRDVVLVTRKTDVDYHVNPSELDGRLTGVVEAGILVAYYGDFLVSAVDRTQRFMDAKPLVVHVGPGVPVVSPPTAVTIAIPGISLTFPVVVGQVYILPITEGVDWTTVIPPGGICVFWHRPGDGDILVGTITLVGGVPQLVFNEAGIVVIANTITTGTVGSVEVSFNINLTVNQVTRIAFTIWVIGTGPVTPPPPAGGDASAIVTVENAFPPKEVE